MAMITLAITQITMIACIQIQSGFTAPKASAAQAIACCWRPVAITVVTGSPRPAALEGRSSLSHF